MSNKELIVPAIVTLSKKLRRSMTDLTDEFTKLRLKETPALVSDVGPDNPEQRHQQIQPLSPDSGYHDGEDNAFPRPPSYQTAVQGDEKGASTSLGHGDNTAPSEWEDIDGGTTAADSSSPSSPSLEMTETRFIDLASSFFPAVPPDATLPPLPKPILIPRVNPGAQIPFARAWPPELANHSITQTDFLTFIDNLNVVMTPHAVIRLFELAGAIVGMVPYDAAEGVGAAVEALAIAAHIAHSYKLTRSYLDKMNEQFFHPRLLHLKIAPTKRVKQILGLEKEDTLIAPLSEDNLDLSTRDRCLVHLSEKISELRFEGLPPPGKQNQMLARIAAWQVKHRVANADKAARAARKRNWKRHQKGKKLKQGWGEAQRVKGLDWIVVQNYSEWEVRKAEKAREKEEKKKKKAMTW